MLSLSPVVSAQARSPKIELLEIPGSFNNFENCCNYGTSASIDENGQMDV